MTMSGRPLLTLSIITPVLNGQDFVGQFISDIQAQTFTDYELIVIDDGSSDETVNILQCRAANDPKLRILRQSANTGAATARNRGLEAARGELLAFVDADDRIDPRRFEKLIALMKTNSCDFIADNQAIYDLIAARNVSTLFICKNGTEAYIDLITYCNSDRPTNSYNIGLIKPIIRADLIMKNNIRFLEKFRSNTDFCFYAEVLALRPKAMLSSMTLYRYTEPVGGRSRRKSPHGRTTIKLTTFIEAVEATIERLAGKLDSAETAALVEHKAALRFHSQIVEQWQERKIFGLFGVILNIIKRSEYRRYVAVKLGLVRHTPTVIG